MNQSDLEPAQRATARLDIFVDRYLFIRNGNPKMCKSIPRRYVLVVTIALLASLDLLRSRSHFFPVAHAATFTVTNTNDSGAGSLRQAILDANNTVHHPGLDTIAFYLPGLGAQTIHLTSA